VKASRFRQSNAMLLSSFSTCEGSGFPFWCAAKLTNVPLWFWSGSWNSHSTTAFTLNGCGL